MDKESIKWQRMRFKKNKVWMAVAAQGDPLLKNGMVLIKYQLDQDHEYWVRRENVQSIDAGQAQSDVNENGPGRPPIKADDDFIDSRSRGNRFCTNAIRIFTDGASSGNPGPSGIGVLLQYGKQRKEISQYIGLATNNIAELKAIETALLSVKNTQIPVRLYTDSNYAHGVLMRNWKPKKNRELVESIKKTMAKFNDVKIIKIKGHSGCVENERADLLATSVITRTAK
jgi:ribonuclease HI